MRKIDFHSWEQQDEFIVNLFGHKTNGTFLDIAAAHPTVGSNTYTLEKFFNWTGQAFDIQDCEEKWQWSQHRSSAFILADATSEAFAQYLATNFKDTVVDYISLDVDAHDTNLALPVLKRILESGIRFKAMTFEHELYMHGDSFRNESRQLLEAQGYVRLFSDVCAWGAKPDRFMANEFFEDWWVDPQYFSEEILKTAATSLHTFTCVNKLRALNNIEYEAEHKCCRSFPDEWTIFIDANDEWWWKGEYQKLKIYDSFNRPDNISRFK